MSLEETSAVVKYKTEYYPHVLVEASGNVTLETIREIAKTGVDAISSLSISHQANWIDLSMRVDG
jgi:nicotinate-nucleotide pyrophosphorylase (carboxylating)